MGRLKEDKRRGRPTVVGGAGYESTSWFGLLARAGTPPAAIEAGLRKPETATRLAAMGVEPVGGAPAAFGDYIARRLREAGELIRTARITAE